MAERSRLKPIRFTNAKNAPVYRPALPANAMEDQIVAAMAALYRADAPRDPRHDRSEFYKCRRGLYELGYREPDVYRVIRRIRALAFPEIHRPHLRLISSQ